MELLILRHAQTQGNLERRYVGRTDEPLCDCGRETARAAHPRRDVAHVYASPLLRAQQTAQICFPNAAIDTIDDLREMDFGSFEYRAFADDLEHDPTYQVWVEASCETACPGGEDKAAFVQRSVRGVCAALNDAWGAGRDYAVIVAHGGTVMAALDQLCDDSREYFEWTCRHVCGYRAHVEKTEDGFAITNPQLVSDLRCVRLRPMKISFNLTTTSDDLERFADSADLEQMIAPRFNGVELMHFGDDQQLVQTKHVTGLHASCYTNWVDLWFEDEESLLSEYGSMDVVEQMFGGTTRDALIRHFKQELEYAKQFEADYLVFHAGDSFTQELLDFGPYHCSDKQVLQATCELLNEVMAGEDNSIAVLLENLWSPGLTLLDPRQVDYLSQHMGFENWGIMLDTGHLAHTDFSLKDEDEAASYIVKRLEALGSGVERIRGMHFQMSITGEYCTQLKANPPKLTGDFWERWGKSFSYSFDIDKHSTFTSPLAYRIFDVVEPEWVTFEFITRCRAELEEKLDTQWKWLLRRAL